MYLLKTKSIQHFVIFWWFRLHIVPEIKIVNLKFCFYFQMNITFWHFSLLYSLTSIDWFFIVQTFQPCSAMLHPHPLFPTVNLAQKTTSINLIV